MATFVWTGATSVTWSTGSNWNVGGVAQGSPPTSSDDVAVGTGTGATNNGITLTANTTVRSVDFTGYTGTFTHNTGVTLSIGDGTPGPSNLAYKMVTGMTYTKGSTTTSAITLTSTSATQQTVATGGKNHGNMTFNGAGGSWLLNENLLANGAAGTTFTLTAGSLDTNSKSITVGRVNISGTSTRSMTLGTTAFVFLAQAGTPGWNAADTTNLTFSGASSSMQLFTGVYEFGGLTYGTVTTSGNTDKTLNGGGTFASWTLGGTSDYTIGANFTVTGAVAMTGNANIDITGTTQTWGTFASAAHTVTMTNATVNLTGTGTVWTGVSTLVATGSTINITNTSATQKTFAGNAKTYENVTVTMGTGDTLLITGSSTFTSLQRVGTGTKTIVLGTTTSTTTLTGGAGSFFGGTAGNLITIRSGTAGSASTLISATAIVTDYISLKDFTASGGTPFYAGANSTNVSGNTDWIFTGPPQTASTYYYYQPAVRRAAVY